MDQLHLFRLAPEAVTVSAHFDGPRGWTVTLAMRRQGEQWADSQQERYAHLSTTELSDVVQAVVDRMLGLV